MLCYFLNVIMYNIPANSNPPIIVTAVPTQNCIANELALVSFFSFLLGAVVSFVAFNAWRFRSR